MANNVILRKLYGHAVIELLTEPQSWQVTADEDFLPLLKVSREKSSFKRDLKIFIETKIKTYLICYTKSTDVKHLPFLSLLS